VSATMSAKFHLNASAALYGISNNSTPGTNTLTDSGGVNFTNYSPPLFVVDNPTNPTAFADVLASTATTLTLSTNFPSATYYLYQLRQVGCQITLTEVGTSTYTMTCNDDTAATVTATQNNL